MKILLCGGGSVGHISPAIAIAEAIKQKNKNAEFLFVSRENGSENDVIIKHKIKLKTILIKINQLIPEGGPFMGKRNRVTTRDIAQYAGVSQSTVSMILSKKKNVSFGEETVERVQAAAAALGYKKPAKKKPAPDRSMLTIKSAMTAA